MKKITSIFSSIFIILVIAGSVKVYSEHKKSKVVCPVVINNILLGGNVDGKWTNAEKMGKMIKGQEKYRIYSISKFLGVGIGSKVTFEEPCGTEWIKIKTKKKIIGDYIAICGKWNALPRKTKHQLRNIPEHVKVIKDILRKNKLEGVKVNIWQNLRVDLEGDGTDEVIISATNLDYNNLKTYRKKRDYSIILLRKIINGKVEDIILEQSFYQKVSDPPYAYKIKFVADVNGDGSMEIVVGDEYYEGYGYAVFEIKDKKAKKVLYNYLGL